MVYVVFGLVIAVVGGTFIEKMHLENYVEDFIRNATWNYFIDMEEKQFSKTYDRIPTPDIAISMGCDVGCPYIGRAFDDNWSLPDPTGQGDEVFKEVIKQIEERIMLL